MKAYYGSRFSENMTATPEGFLVCHNVPISRVGWYEYLADEMGVIDAPSKIVKVYRSPEEVFSVASMASFEGKPAVDEHPPEQVTPDNATRYVRGTVKNVRQGKGEDVDLLLADIIIYDEYLIQEIMDGKRDVSCGYDLTYEPLGDGTYQQVNIRGNHVAVVNKGRAGDRISIKDHKPKGVNEKMAKKVALPRRPYRMTDFLAAMGLKQLALDADPEEIREAVDAMAEEKKDVAEDAAGKEENPFAKDNDIVIKTIMEQMKSLQEAIAKLESRTEAKDEDSAEKALDDAIAELGKPATDDGEEESHTIETGAMDDEIVKGPVAPANERPQQVIDNGYRVAALRAIKPILAAIADPAERKRAADAAIASIKAVPTKNTYAAIQKGQSKVAKDAAANDKQVQDVADLGKQWAAKYNPHYMDKGVKN